MISLHNISLKQDEFQLKIAALQIPVGLTLLVGRNGAGKSTLLSILATAISSGQGEVRYGGKTTETALPLIRRNIGYIPSGLLLYEEMTVIQHLLYLAQLKGIYNKQEIEALLLEFDLGALRNRKLKLLSQGEQQRVAIAQAFLGAPAFLFMDEPLNNLDSLERKRIISKVIRYTSRHLVIVATHELNEWSEQAGHILLLNQGQVLFFDKVEHWMQDLPEQVWVGTLPMQEIAEMQANERLQQERIIRLKLHGTEASIRLLSKLQPDERFSRVAPTLEDAYFIRMLRI